MDGDIARSRVFPTVEPATYAEFYKRLATALAGKGDVPVNASDASIVIKLIELARESSQTGRTLDVKIYSTDP